MNESTYSRDWDKVEWDKLDEETLAELMLQRITEDPAVFTDEQIDAIEKRAQADGITRRAMLAFLSKPGKWALETIAQDREAAVAFADLQAQILDYLDRDKSMREFFAAANVRILIALAQREDMDEIIAEVNPRKARKA